MTECRKNENFLGLRSRKISSGVCGGLGGGSGTKQRRGGLGHLHSASPKFQVTAGFCVPPPSNLREVQACKVLGWNGWDPTIGSSYGLELREARVFIS